MAFIDQFTDFCYFCNCVLNDYNQDYYFKSTDVCKRCSIDHFEELDQFEKVNKK